jgi:glycosyltransferase involved in cell wall biosynthesis
MGVPPTVSIGMPVYNGGRWIGEAIDALLGQRLRDFELIVSDNASSDDTAAIVQAYAARDARVRYVRQATNIGSFRNHDAVFHLSSGRYFKWAACSDVCLDGFLERCVSVLETRPDVVLAYVGTRLLLDDGRTEDYDDWLDLDIDGPAIRFRRYLDRVRLNTPFHGVIRRASIARTALNLPLPGSDISLVAELTLHGKFVELPERLFLRRFTPETTVILAGTGTTSRRPRQRIWPRASLHLKRFSIPWRAPISVREKCRVSAYLLKRSAGMAAAAASAARRSVRRRLRA